MKRTTLNKSIIIALSMFSISSFADENVAPYNWVNKAGNTPFQVALDQVKLTSPDGSTKLADSSSSKAELSFDGYATDNFNMSVGKNYMQITHEGAKSSRTEMRHLTEFNLFDENSMEGIFKVASTTDGLDEVTVLQVHNVSKEIGAPLMRIAQIVEDGVTFYQAKVRLSDCNKKTCDAEYATYNWLDENGFPTVTTNEFRSFSVNVNNGVLEMLLDDKHGTLMCNSHGVTSAANCTDEDKIHTNADGDHVVSDWVDDGFYFKSGAYIQDAGKAVIRYKELEFNVVDAFGL